jgi:hypothetical protein
LDAPQTEQRSRVRKREPGGTISVDQRDRSKAAAAALTRQARSLAAAAEHRPALVELVVAGYRRAKVEPEVGSTAGLERAAREATVAETERRRVSILARRRGLHVS